MRLYYCLHINLGNIKSLVSSLWLHWLHGTSLHLSLPDASMSSWWPWNKQAMVDRMYLSVLSLVLALGVCLGVGAHHDGQHHHHSPDDVDVG